MKNTLKGIRVDHIDDFVVKRPGTEDEKRSVLHRKSLGLIGRLPNFHRSGCNYKFNTKCNRYLAWQEVRIWNAISKGETRRAVLIWMTLMKSSVSYQVQLFNACCKTWYWALSSDKVEETLFGAINKMRKWDMTLLINRFYIEKKNGKMRPIGAPNYESRMISKAFTDMIYAITEKDRCSEQHAYMKNRGSWSAILDVIEKLKDGYDGYEFDLKGFFNTVEPFIIHRKLSEVNKEITIVISNLIKNIEYRWERLMPETELHTKPHKRNTIVRTGVPQGLSLSPLLSTWALEYFGRPKNLVMYADDGIYFFKHNMSRFTRWMAKMEYAGVEIAPEKSAPLANQFKFCGFEVDRVTKIVSFGTECRRWDAKDLKEWLKLVANKYYKKKDDWKWTVHPESFANFRQLNLTMLEKTLVWFNRIWKNKMYRGYKIFDKNGRIYDVLGTSSWGCNELLKIVNYKTGLLAKRGQFNFDPKSITAFSYAPCAKGHYKRYFNNGNGPSKNSNLTYFEIMEFHNLKRAQLKPIIE